MRNIDDLLKQARAVSGIKGNDLNNYDFTRITTDELIEMAYGNPAEERFSELVMKAFKKG